MPVAVDDGDVVVLLQRDDDLAVGVDVDEFGLRVFRRDAGEAGQVDAARWRRSPGAPSASGTIARLPAGQLRDGAVVHLLVALVLDGDGEEAAVRR